MSKSNKLQDRKAIRAKLTYKAHRGATAKSRHKSAPAQGVAKANKPIARDSSKLASLIAMLRRPKGTSIADLCKATGWQAHSVRGAISGVLKKKRGLPVTSSVGSDGVRSYRIVD